MDCFDFPHSVVSEFRQSLLVVFPMLDDLQKKVDAFLKQYFASNILLSYTSLVFPLS